MASLTNGIGWDENTMNIMNARFFHGRAKSLENWAVILQSSLVSDFVMLCLRKPQAMEVVGNGFNFNDKRLDTCVNAER